jgi:hypothetical protein
MMADYNGWTHEREEKREAMDQAELTSGVAVGARREFPRRYRERLLRAAAREILGHAGSQVGRSRSS